ncbi:amino acid ABC transporter permease [Miltoncostaea marina]|uniref:amino acid ABC transporter permease n=1 Tax=Miltoncostaea marina TaxID=2843215 RepID=UPI001C3E6126|nr:amino acid ABC transporter permease [Miltoncostaea marina]
MSATGDPAPAGVRAASERRVAREAARRRRARRGAAVATLSSVLVLGALVALVLSSPGWGDVQETFFSWEVFRDAFPDVLRGFWLDVKLFLVVEAIVIVAGLGVALMRVGRAPAFFPFRMLATVYTDVFRGVPVILVVYLVGFGVPALGTSGWFADPVVLGGFGLALCYTAYVAEVYRAGLDSIHPSQRAAALAVGLTEGQAMRHVIVPQAVRRVVPPLLNDFISLQKDVALVSILGPQEAFRVAQIEAASDFNYTPFLAAALLYLAVTVPLARVVDHQQARARRRRGQAAPA